MNFKHINHFFVLFLLLSACKNTKGESISEAATSENIEKVITANLELEIKATLGEGAFWNHKTSQLYWVDIMGKQLHIYDPETKQNTSFSTPSMIGTVVPQTDSTSVVALEDGIYILNLKDSSFERISDVESDMPGNRFNDGKCDPNGNLWVGSLHLAETEPAASLYKVEPSGTTTKMLDSITISNGIVWTEDASTMYYIDTPTATIRAFDYDKETSVISNERVAVNVPESVGYPDGMAIDEEDKLWVGLWNGNAVVRFDPLTGELISSIEVPAHNVTSCAFGGENLDLLYITTARKDMSPEEMEQFPLAGSIFIAKPGVRGVKSPFFGLKN